MVKKRVSAARLPGESFPLTETGKRDSAVARVVRALVRLSMDAEDGAYLGSELGLLAKLQVSRPTLRQAAKILQNDQMIEVRRGLNGGFYACRPEARHVVQGPAFYLRLKGATLSEAGVAMNVIMSSNAAAAALNPDATLRAALRGLAEELAGMDDAAYTTSYLLGFEQRLIKLVARMGQNPFLELFVTIVNEFGLLERDLRFYENISARKMLWRDLQLEYCRAILEGDPEHATLLVHRRSTLVDKWIHEDSPADSKTAAAAAAL